MRAACASQSSRLGRRAPLASNQVPTSSPASAAPACAAAVSSVGTPAAVAIPAASTLVTMPPVPTPAAPAEPIRDAVEVVGRRAPAAIRRTPGRAGVAVVEGVDVGQQHQQRRRATRWATSAASRSLSPNRISSVATVSFSLTTGHDAEPEQPVQRAAARCA